MKSPYYHRNIAAGRCGQCGRSREEGSSPTLCAPCRNRINTRNLEVARIASGNQHDAPRRPYRCSRCGGHGHPKRTCPKGAA